MSAQHFMSKALLLAHTAFSLGEVPVGAVVVKDDAIIGMGFNRREMNASSLAHAELLAIADAHNNLGAWRLMGATIYSTLEPCIMCAGAILHARIDHVVFGAHDPKFGAIESLYKLGQDARLNHAFTHEAGFMADECQDIMKEFFRKLRLYGRMR